MTTLACGFAVSGYGTPMFFTMLEKGAMVNMSKFST